MQALQPGQLLGGKYRLVRLLGQGGMGSVWHAQHLTLNAPVALKFIDAEELDAVALQRFLAEARVAAALRSPHVVQILDYGLDEEMPHFAMELLEGESLAVRLAREGRLDVEQTLRVVQHVTRAISRAHDAGIIHRDLKPANVFIVRNDDEELIKVLDFGIAKSTRGLLGDSAVPSTRTGSLLGTPYYMSPEQLDAAKSIDFRTDLWSLGVLVYQCLLGKLPFTGGSIGSMVLSICSRPPPVPSREGEVPPGFDAWFARACAREVEARFASAREAATAFAALCASAGTLVSTPRSGVARRSNPPLPQGATDLPPALGLGTTSQATSAEAPLPPAPSVRRRRIILAGTVLLVLAVVIVAATLGERISPSAVLPPALSPSGSGGVAAARPLPVPSREPSEPSGVKERATLAVQPAPPAAPAPSASPAAVAPANTAATSARPASERAASKAAERPARPAAPPPAKRASEPAPRGRVPELPPANVDLGI